MASPLDPNSQLNIPDVASNIGSGLTGIDALISAQMKLVQAQTTAAGKQSLLIAKQAKKQNRLNRQQNAALNAEIAANQNPSNVIPPAPSMSNAEVQQAADQVRIDAAKRTGQRRSILAGNTGTVSPATGMASLLG